MNQPTLQISYLYFFVFFLVPPSIAQIQPLSFKPQLLCIDNNEACAIADVNQDGQLDVIAGRLWYAAPNFVPRPLRAIAVHPPDYAKNNGEHSIDVNKDGWPDLVTSAWGDGRIRWFKNPGKTDLEKGLPWNATTLAETKNPRGEIGLMHDIDGDGQAEYIINSWDKQTPFTIWRLADYVKNDPIMLGTIIGPYNSHGVGFGDINGDGKTDILTDDGWYEQPQTNIWAGNWTFHKDWNFAGAGCPMQVVDLNEDGRNDIIWGRGHQFGLFWQEQKETIGDSTVWVQHIIDRSWSQTHAMTWADLDGDGKGELITGKRIKAHSGKDPGSDDAAYVYRYVWNKEKQRFNRQEIAQGKVGTGLLIRVADLNADNKPDIVMAGKTGTYILWQQ
jgi:hypothetical protein